MKSTKVHLYWAMKNCCGTKEDFQKRVLNISKHYQVFLMLEWYVCGVMKHCANRESTVLATRSRLVVVLDTHPPNKHWRTLRLLRLTSRLSRQRWSTNMRSLPSRYVLVVHTCVQYIVEGTNVLTHYIVPWYILGGILQPPASFLPSKEDSLWK